MNKFWDPVLRPLLRAIAPKRICEIGSDHGLCTRKILEYCIESDAFLEIIDPDPKYKPSEFLAPFQRLCRFHQALSLNALHSIPACDVYLIDGDHNWYTVINELRLIEKKASKADPPLIALHDTGWPYGHRDLYYNPDNIPAEYRQTFKQLGLRFGQSELCPKGGINAHLNNALYENDLNNGVKTAVDNFIQESKNKYQQIHFPVWHGLTILVPEVIIKKNACLKEFLEKTKLASFHENLINEIEADRLDFFYQISEIKRLNGLQLEKNDELSKKNVQQGSYLAQLESEKKIVLAQHEKVNVALASLTEEKKRLCKRVEAHKAKCSNLEHQLNTVRQTLASVEEGRSHLTGRIRELEAERLFHLKEREASMQNLLVSAEENERLRERVKKRDAELFNAESQLQSVRQGLTSSEENLSFFREQVKELEGRLQSAEAEREEAARSFSRIADENEYIRKRLGEIEAERSALESQLQATRESLRHSDDSLSILASQIAERARPIEPIKTHIAINQMPLALRHLIAVDVIVPVYNALDDVKNCLESLSTHSDGFDQRIVIVNDGSDETTTEWLKNWGANQDNVTLIDNKLNTGYTRAVNAGLRSSSAPYVVLLNSDTIVTPGWIEGLIRCAISEESIGIVGPLSNAASWQSVPVVIDETGNFAINQLPPDISVEEIAKIVREESARIYPRMPFLNGFCFMIKRKLIEAIGLMDDDNFPIGYGEENDYCIRAADAGFSLAVADDTYVFHTKSKSFGHDQRKELSRKGSSALRQKHGEERVKQLVDQVKDNKLLGPIRQKVNAGILSRQQKNVIKPLSMNILFLLPVKGGSGGAHSVVQETAAMRRLGVEARIAVKLKNLDHMHKLYHDVPNVDDLFVGFDDHTIVGISSEYDIAVATIFNSVDILVRIVDAHPHIMPAYYVQDYEPMFFEPGSELWSQARGSYTQLRNCVLFAKTRWIVREVEREHGVAVHKVSPSIDHETYSPCTRSEDGLVHISAMIRPKTPRRGAERTMRVLGEVAKRHPGKVAIHIFGCEGSGQQFQELYRDFSFRLYGVLTRAKVAELLRQSDIFVDLSDYQAFGRTGLEAMASGCAVMVPKYGGTDEYAIDSKNAVVVDSFDEQQCISRLESLIEDSTELNKLKIAGLETAARYSTHRAAITEVNLLSKMLSSYRKTHPLVEKPSLVLLSARKKNGAPAGSSYARLLPWSNKNIRRNWKVLEHKENVLPSPDIADVAIIQRDAAGLDLNRLKQWVTDWRQAGKKFIFEVDDDLFDAEGFLRRGYEGDPARLVAAIQWLAQSADAVTVSTEALRHNYLKLNENVFLVPNYLYPNIWRIGLPRPAGKEVFVKQPGDPIRIGYIGTPTHDQDLALVAEAIRKIESEYGERVCVEIIGAFQNKEPLFGKRIGLPKNNDYPNFVEWLHKRVNWDIGIIPLIDNRFNNSKSHLKFIEYSALRLATICSDVPSYRNVVRNGENGLLVDNTTDAWYMAIKRLVDDAGFRISLVTNAYKDISESYTTTANAALYSDVLANVLALDRRTDIPVLTQSMAAQNDTSEVFNKVSVFAPTEDGVKPDLVFRPSEPEALIDAPSASSTQKMRRKLKKLRREPYRFFADSRYSVLRGVSSLFR